MRNYKAFTLIELIMAISLTTMISSSIIMLFSSGIDSWTYGVASSELQETASLIMDQVIEGAYKFDGLREVGEISYAGENEIGFIPWWEQRFKRIKPLQKYPLELTPAPDSPTPIALIWNHQTSAYELTDILFYAKGEELGDEKSYIAFTDDIREGSSGKVFYYPDYKYLSKTEMRLFYKQNEDQIYRSYKKEQFPLIRGKDKVMIDELKFEYLNAANTIIPYKDLNNLNPLNNPITAVRVIVSVKQGEETYTLRSFVGVRKKGIASGGVLMTEGAHIPIPNSKDCKTLSMINFFGIERSGEIKCLIHSKQEQKKYILRIFFSLNDDKPWIDRYEIEYPPGKKVYDYDINASALRGINLLTLDFSGQYDYDIDEEVGKQVDFKSDSVVFKVLKCDIGGFYLIVR